MIWDLALLGIILYNVARCAKRGGLAVGIPLFSFFLAYAVTWLLAPPFASLLSAHTSVPPTLVSLLCMLAVYLSAKRQIKALLQSRLLPAGTNAVGSAATLRSRHTGAWLGIMRGVMVATAFAIIGTSFAQLQDMGHLEHWPDVGASRGVEAADELMSLVLDRYTRDAGPTTRQLIAFVQHPRRETLDAILEGPFFTRIKASDEVRALARDQEFRRLIRKQQTAPILMHPAFLRVVSHTVRELQLEESVVDAHLR